MYFRCSSLASYAMFRTGLQATHVVLGGNLMCTGTVLVTPVIDHLSFKCFYYEDFINILYFLTNIFYKIILWGDPAKEAKKNNRFSSVFFFHEFCEREDIDTLKLSVPYSSRILLAVCTADCNENLSNLIRIKHPGLETRENIVGN